MVLIKKPSLTVLLGVGLVGMTLMNLYLLDLGLDVPKAWLRLGRDHGHEVVRTTNHEKEGSNVTTKHVYRPQVHFRDALLPNERYITSWTSGGLTNAFISHVNLLYLSVLSNRIPILSPLTPTHLDKWDVIPFTEIYDLRQLEDKLDMQVIEWHQIKQYELGKRPPPQNTDKLNCWSTRMTFETSPSRATRSQDQLGLNVSFAPAPPSTKASEAKFEVFNNLLELTSLISPTSRAHVLSYLTSLPSSSFSFFSPSDMNSSSLAGNLLIVPDDQVACFDLLYYTATHFAFEWEREGSPSWNFVGRHVKWNKTLKAIADGYAERLLGGNKPFISVHVRRTDFGNACPPSKPKLSCLPPLSSYATLVSDVQAALSSLNQSSSQENIIDVILSSDDDTPAFKSLVAQQGWKMIDHVSERTTEKYGLFYEALVDIVVQSLAVGFVGTKHSTLSIVSSKRVVEWNGGVARMVDWNAFA